MIRLLLETATDVCSVAVADGNSLLAEHTAAEAFRHASHLTLFIRQVMNEAGLPLAAAREVVLSDGPGSYTSLRVGAATAKGLCVALPGLALRVVPTLTALAYATATEELVLATINSRRGQVYAQLYDKRALPRVPGTGEAERTEDVWTSPTNLDLTEDKWEENLASWAGGRTLTVTGPGQDRVRHASADPDRYRFAAPAICRASHLLAPAAAPALSSLVEVASYEPCYVNPPFVTKSKKNTLG